MKKTLLAWLVVSLCGFSAAAHSVVIEITLDNTNLFNSEIDGELPDETLQQPGFLVNQISPDTYITGGPNLFFDIGSASLADFGDEQTQIGGGWLLGSYTVEQLVTSVEGGCPICDKDSNRQTVRRPPPFLPVWS